MKKILTKIKIILSTLWITLISFSSKVMGQSVWNEQKDKKFGIQAIYGVKEYYEPSPLVPILNAIQRLTGIAIFIIGIITLIRIIRTDDKNLKKKRIKKTIITISILIVILIITYFISSRVLSSRSLKQ